jgi:hypothetical protein
MKTSIRSEPPFPHLLPNPTDPKHVRNINPPILKLTFPTATSLKDYANSFRQQSKLGQKKVSVPSPSSSKSKSTN